MVWKVRQGGGVDVFIGLALGVAYGESREHLPEWNVSAKITTH